MSMVLIIWYGMLSMCIIYMNILSMQCQLGVAHPCCARIQSLTNLARMSTPSEARYVGSPHTATPQLPAKIVVYTHSLTTGPHRAVL